MEQINAVGRRKAAIARVFVKEGTGVITINNRALENYFPNPILQYIVKQPLTLLDVLEKYDIKYPGAASYTEPYLNDDPWQSYKMYEDDKYIVSYLSYMENELLNLQVSGLLSRN